MLNVKDFYKEMLAIAIPIALQNLIVSSLNTLDTVMLSLIHISEPTRREWLSRMPSSA